jgi:hypothetical protein
MNVINCETCRWVGCRNYGYDRPACIKYIPELTATSKPPQPARITEYDSGKNCCAVCGRPTLHTHAVTETLRVRVCRKCEKRMPPEFWKGVAVVDQRRKESDDGMDKR